jgi:hypothetical protein
VFRRQEDFTPVVGVKVGGIVPRQSIQQLQADTDVFNMFIWGLVRSASLLGQQPSE